MGLQIPKKQMSDRDAMAGPPTALIGLPSSPTDRLRTTLLHKASLYHHCCSIPFTEIRSADEPTAQTVRTAATYRAVAAPAYPLPLDRRHLACAAIGCMYGHHPGLGGWRIYLRPLVRKLPPGKWVIWKLSVVVVIGTRPGGEGAITAYEHCDQQEHGTEFMVRLLPVIHTRSWSKA